MQMVVNYLKDLNITEIVASELIDHEARREIICTSWATLDKNECNKLLINKLDSARLFDQQMSGALKIVQLMNDLRLPRETGIAILNKNISQYDEFFEVMAQLKGFSVKNFTDREIALQWLCQSCF